METTTTNSGTSSANEIRAGLLEVLSCCPVEQCNPSDCPLFQLRQMDYPQRLRWFNSLEQSDLEYLAAYHYICIKVKLRECPGNVADEANAP
jgi:hypothetical protein